MAHELHAEDRQAIGETLSLHGHLFDGGHLDRLGEIFTPDVVYDMSAVGVGTFEGIEAVRGAALRLGPGNPVAHHLANVVVSGGGDGTATALSKGLALLALHEREGRGHNGKHTGAGLPFHEVRSTLRY